MSDDTSDSQQIVIKDLYTRAGLYPSENSHDPEHLFRYGELLKSLSNALEPYEYEDYDEEYKEIRRKMAEISKYRYTHRDRYISEGYEILHDWYGLISKKLDYLNILLPHNYTYVEGGEDGL